MPNAAEKPSGSMMLLPPKDGLCRICAVDHRPDEAHNARSLFYQVRFRMRYGRDGTWADAIAHCPAKHRPLWEQALREHGAWSQPAEGVDPIAEPIDS